MKTMVIALFLLFIAQQSLAIPPGDGSPDGGGSPIDFDFDGSKNCYHNGDFYITIAAEGMCPGFVPYYDPVTQKWGHIPVGVGAIANPYHEPTNERCNITYDNN